MAVLDLKLFLSGSANRTYTCASTAANTCVSVDNVLAVTFRNCLNGALSSASAARDAIIRNFISHRNDPPCDFLS